MNYVATLKATTVVPATLPCDTKDNSAAVLIDGSKFNIIAALSQEVLSTFAAGQVVEVRLCNGSADGSKLICICLRDLQLATLQIVVLAHSGGDSDDAHENAGELVDTIERARLAAIEVGVGFC
jgi:hypothetical protein